MLSALTAHSPVQFRGGGPFEPGCQTPPPPLRSNGWAHQKHCRTSEIAPHSDLKIKANLIQPHSPPQNLVQNNANGKQYGLPLGPVFQTPPPIHSGLKGVAEWQWIAGQGPPHFTSDPLVPSSAVCHIREDGTAAVPKTLHHRGSTTSTLGQDTGKPEMAPSDIIAAHGVAAG